MSLNINTIIQECMYEVFKERLTEGVEKCPTCGTPNSKCNCSIIARVQAYKQLNDKITSGNATPEEIAQFQKERIWVRSILKQAGYGVQGGMYLRNEGFDPQSAAGPNPGACQQTQHDPYKAWNMKMRKMEENEHGREAQIAGAGQFDPRTFGVNETLELTPTGGEDEWSRPIYNDQNGKHYVDINLGRGTPSIHSVSDSGEPEFPVKNFKVVAAPAQGPVSISPTGKNDKYDRPMYVDANGKYYVDIHAGKGARPWLVSLDSDGELDIDIRFNYTLV